MASLRAGMQTFSQISPNWMARTGHQIDRIRINRLQKETVNGRPAWVKHRTVSSRWLVPVANGFFRLAANPVRVLPTDERWQEREIGSFRLLNGVERSAGTLGGASVYFEALPGLDLVALLQNGCLSEEIVRRTGMAFLRMHQTINSQTGDFFSHGDPHLGNVIYHSGDQAVGWIDFETEHADFLSAEERQADDLLVFLLDLAGRVNWEVWTSLSVAFLNGYENPEIIARLVKRLIPATGFAAIWQSVRTSYLSRKELARRMAWLRVRI